MSLKLQNLPVEVWDRGLLSAFDKIDEEKDPGH